MHTNNCLIPVCNVIYNLDYSFHRIKSYRLKKAKNEEGFRLSQPTDGQTAELKDEMNAYEGIEII